MSKKDEQEPQGFQPIEYTPPDLNDELATAEWKPIEVTPHDLQAAPAVTHQKPAAGEKES
jgi:hypothetical protein